MNGRIVIAAGLIALFSSTAGAQVSPSCPGGTIQEQATQDACQKAIDLFQYMAPQLGTVVAGGNATLGQGGTLGGFPHFSVGIRANALHGSLPNIEAHDPSVTGAQQSTYEPKSQFLGLPAVDAAIGVFAGLPLGLTNVGGVDLLLSAWYIPEIAGQGVEVAAPDGSLKIGYGARVGLLQESLLMPGLSATYMKRDLPVLDLTGTAGNGSLAVRALDVQTTSWRIVASKSMILFGLAAGFGKDTYKTSANIQASAGGFDSQEFAAAQNITRTSVFGNASMSLLMLKAVAEIGHVSGGEIVTYNQFDGKKADDSRLYGSIGLRFGF
ncbi:MAG TPA: hypothetical protein VMM18_09355 [Gemmatimonadaceae bacterium]|nr:hypothetical protein [Gemmatimonadaceae bacterium]